MSTADTPYEATNNDGGEGLSSTNDEELKDVRAAIQTKDAAKLAALLSPSLPTVVKLLSATDQFGETALHLAAAIGNVECVRLLLGKCTGAPENMLHIRDQWSRVPAQVAAEHGYNIVADEIANACGCDDCIHAVAEARTGEARKGEASDRWPLTDLQTTALRNELARSVISRGAKPRTVNVTVKSVFSEQVESFQISDVSTPTTAPPPPPPPPPTSEPLSSHGKFPTITILPNSPGSSNSPLAAVVSGGKAKSSLGQLKKSLSSCIEYPATVEEVRGMLAAPDKYDARGRDMFGWTALHKVASWDQTDVLEELLGWLREHSSSEGEFRAALNERSAGGETALECAREAGAVGSAAVLMRWGAGGSE
ncbi:hypothetical protein HDU83_002880 [Entophlyctis luteolus]|nr:hypothetical protein HDU83_002880 [Entophlyctis luteolus]